MKKYLNDFIKKKEERAKELRKLIQAASTADEVRSLGDTLNAVLEELQDAKKALDELDEENEGDNSGDNNGDNSGDEGRSTIPAGAQVRNAELSPLATFKTLRALQEREKTDPHDTAEYRAAFMNYVCRNVPIPAEMRAAATTSAADAGAVIPTTLMNEIIMKLDTYGNIYAKVRKLNVQGGVAIPIVSLKPEANWVGEGSSDSQKIEGKNKITFSYFGVECKIAQTLLVNVATIEAFQALFIPLAAEAIVKALEIAIMNGNGTTQPLGILKDSRVPAANVITITPSEFASWEGWHKKVKEKMKKAYRNGDFIMNQATFDGYIDGMVDKNGQPIGRTNYGINGEETYRFLGKTVETVEDDLIASWDDAKKGDVVAVFANLQDYAINSNMQMTAVKWTDNDTNEVKNKCIMIVDGKLVDANGVLIIKKGEDAASAAVSGS